MTTDNTTDANTAGERLVAECSAWLYQRRSAAMAGATFESFLGDPLVADAVARMVQQRVRRAVAQDRAGTPGWRDESALAYAEAHEGYRRSRRVNEAAAFVEASALQAGRAQIAAGADGIVDKAVSQAIQDITPPLSGKFHQMQRRLDALEHTTFELEVRAAGEDLPDADLPWTAEFVRDHTRRVERIQMRAPGARGWNGNIERDPYGTIAKVAFAPAP